MQFIIETIPNDIALMFVTYLGFCLLLMFLFIRADCKWNKREMNMACDHLRLLSEDHDKSGRLRELTACSAHHDVDCACFLQDRSATREESRNENKDENQQARMLPDKVGSRIG